MKFVNERKWLFLLLVSALGLFLDLWTKSLAMKYLIQGRPVQVLGDVLSWNLVYNKKAIFGIDPASIITFMPAGPVFMALSLAAVAMLVVFYGQQKKADPVWVKIGLAVVMPGALGNLYDRIFFSTRGVVDFIQMNFHFPPANPWPIYNLADAYITVGVVVLLGVMISDEMRRKKLTAAAPSTGPGTEPAHADESAAGKV